MQLMNQQKMHNLNWWKYPVQDFLNGSTKTWKPDAVVSYHNIPDESSTVKH